MTRKEELCDLFSKDELTTIEPLIDEVVFLEKRLTELKMLPMLRVHPDNPEMQKPTPAAKQYKEFLQQYANCIKLLSKVAGVDEVVEESPLRKWVNEHVNTE